VWLRPIPGYKVFPHNQQQAYLPLQPGHVEQMLASFEEHRRELLVMQEPHISLLGCGKCAA
jgi:hypothetical protein